MNNTIFTTKRRDYWRYDVLIGHVAIGRLISTSAGYLLETQDPMLLKIRGRYFRTPGDLLDAVRLQRLRHGGACQ